MLDRIPAPDGFRPAGHVLTAEFTTPPALRKKRYSGRRLAGVQYEKKVHAYLEQLYGERYVQSPWLKFFSDGKWRWCQPDALVIDLPRGRILIIEVKYQHTSDAWWQVRRLYEPVLRIIFPDVLWTYEFCEVVKWYDPAVDFPEKVVLAQEPGMPHKAFKVHIYRP